MNTLKKTLVTSALPYANGDIHLGHLVEYIQTDIFVRFLRLTGSDVIYICASDAHGTPIEINASKRGITPQELVGEFHRRHQTDFARFEISFDEFYTTDSPENKHHSEIIYERAKEKGHIEVREIEQFYCEACGRFLPDRFIRGSCPKCKTPDQYGDVCESCGATYRPTEISDAHCALCGASPTLRTSKHFFFKLIDFRDFLDAWTSHPGRLQSEVKGFVQTWIDQGLQDWDISRDGPYFGFKIPGEADKYFYVWLDAPIGYIAATQHYCDKREDRKVEDYWIEADSETEIRHFIGKDIASFHTLFWPATLKAAEYRTPDKIHVHGFLTVDSRKMSKSRGTFVTARMFADFLNPLYLRYYYATKLGNSIDDLDLNLEEFVNRTNSELVNNITNLISRTIGFLNKRLESRLGEIPGDVQELIGQVEASVTRAFEDYQGLRFNNVTRDILSISDLANNFVQHRAPWNTVKSDPERARNDLTFVVNCIKILTVLLKPIVPSYCARVEDMLGVGDLTWSDAGFDLQHCAIGKFDKLMDRIEAGVMEKLIEASRDSMVKKPDESIQKLPDLKTEIGIEDFSKVDLRVGRIVSAQYVEGSDKLLKLEVDVGRETRTIFAGIKSSYRPDDLAGIGVAVVCNLKPRKMRFGTSSGMVLASALPNGKVALCQVNENVPPGTPIT